MEFKQGKGQRSCLFAKVERDGTVWCVKNEWVCGISKGSKCTEFQPTLTHFEEDVSVGDEGAA